MRDQAAGRIQQAVEIGLDESLRFHRRDHLGRDHGFAVVADPPGLRRQCRCFFRVARADHAPAVDEDLRPDLFGHHPPVERHRAALRRGDALLEPQVGGVLGGIAQPAPPQDRLVLDDVVQPGAPDLFAAQVVAAGVVLERADEGERAGDVVVGDDQGLIQALVHVIPDLAQLRRDAFVAPAFKRPAQVDADHLAQHARIHPFEIILRKLAHHLSIHQSCFFTAQP